MVCRTLDGIPIAIELAAAQVSVLGVEEIARQLVDHLQHRSGRSRVEPTLQATLDWSYAQLTDPQRALFRRVAILRGSFDLDAVEAVGEGSAPGGLSWGWTALHAGQNPGLDGASILVLLTELVDAALIQVADSA